MNKLSIERLSDFERDPSNNFMTRSEMMEAIKELIALRKELKGDQVPIAWTDAEELRGMEKDGCSYLFKVDPANPFTDPRRQIMLYDRPQKPVISKEKLCDWLEDNFDIDDNQRDAFANCFAHCCDCIVQSHSPAPVGEIVAWSGTDREKGITREVDFRFLRFDVLPGTKLYAGEPAPAAKSDLLTRAEALAVGTRALASRIKAAE